MGFRMYRDPNTTSTSTTKGYFSAEYPTASYRPCLEIAYEYTPVYPVASGGVYSIENVNSSKRITVPSASTNAFQMQAINYNNQAFRLVGEDGIYTIQPISRTNEALTWDYTDGSAPQTATNLYSAALTSANADKQEFLLHYEGDNDLGYPCFSILSRADTRMALTAYGTATGSATGTSTTSNGNVYIDEYTGGASQLWCFYSGGMPCLIGNDIVAGNGTTMAYNYGVHATNIQPFAYVTAFGETISWESSNTGTVSFDTEGFASINGIGTVTLTARIKNSAGTLLRSYAYTVCIAMDNDVYYIKNAKTGGYLGLPNVELTNGIDVEMQSQITSGDSMYGQLWKVYHIGNGVYSIRSMRDLSRGLDVTGNVVDIYGIGLTDTLSGVPGYAKWDLVVNELGKYRIRYQGSDQKTLYATETTVGLNAAGTTATAVQNAGQAWVFEKADYNQDAMFVPEVSEIMIGEYKSISVVYCTLPAQNQTTTWTSSNTNVATIDNTGFLVGFSRGNTQITASNGSLSLSFPLTVHKKAIIILPGMIGSQIYAAEEFELPADGDNWIANTISAGTRLWDPSTSELSLIKEKVLALACDSSGTPIYPTCVNSPTINTRNRTDNDFHYGAEDTYRALYNALYDAHYSDGYDIVFYEYDWRQDPYHTSIELNQFVETNYYDDIVFVSHSMGGLVSSYYLSLGETHRNRVDKHISIGTPYLGSVEVPYYYLTGEIISLEWYEEFFQIYNGIKSIVNNTPSIYALLPYSNMFQDYLSYGTVNISSFAATETALVNMMPNWNTQLMNQTKDRRNNLFVNGNHVTNLVDSYYLVGVGKETTHSLKGTLDDNMFESFETMKDTNGDGVVTVHSATMGGSTPPLRTFFKEQRLDSLAGHTAIIQGGDLSTFNFLAEIINETIESRTAAELDSVYGIYLSTDIGG